MGLPSSHDWENMKCTRINFAQPFYPIDMRKKFTNMSNSGIDLLSKLLCYNPFQRISAKEALMHPFLK